VLLVINLFFVLLALPIRDKLTKLLTTYLFSCLTLFFGSLPHITVLIMMILKIRTDCVKEAAGFLEQAGYMLMLKLYLIVSSVINLISLVYSCAKAIACCRYSINEAKRYKREYEELKHKHHTPSNEEQNDGEETEIEGVELEDKTEKTE